MYICRKCRSPSPGAVHYAKIHLSITKGGRNWKEMKVSTGLTAANNKRYNSNDEYKYIFLN